MSTDLDLATLDHWFGWMRDSESWRREREIVYGMWTEIERLRELRDTILKGEVAIRRRDADEIERLRGLLREISDLSRRIDDLDERVREALGE